MKIPSEKKTTILMAMSGNLDSTVAAYLLAKQGYQCIGVGFVFHDSGEDHQLNIQCSIKDLNRVKTICDNLNIPFYAVNASKEFEHQVTSRAVAARLDGRSCSPDVYAHALIIELLIQKSKLLNCQKIATGHYGSIFRNNQGQHWATSANDLQHDQSYLFALVPDEHLAMLELPLSSVKKQEVIKIAKTISIQFSNTMPAMENFFGSNENFNRFLQKQVAPSLLSPGSILRLKDDSHVAEHESVHAFSLGDSKLSLGKDGNYLDKALTVLKVTPRNGMVYIGFPEELATKIIIAKNFDVHQRLNLSRPLAVFVKINVQGDFFPAYLFPKNNAQIELELTTPLIRIFPGMEIGIYLKNENKYRLIGGATITQTIQDQVLQQNEEDNTATNRESDNGPQNAQLEFEI